MKKFFVLFCIPAAAIQEWIKNVGEETRKKQTNEMMESWRQWMAAHDKSIIDKGLPVGKTKRITEGAVADARNDVNWYLVVEAPSHDEAVAMFTDHPHLHIPTAFIDVSDAEQRGM